MAQLGCCWYIPTTRTFLLPGQCQEPPYASGETTTPSNRLYTLGWEGHGDGCANALSLMVSIPLWSSMRFLVSGSPSPLPS